MTDSPFLYDAKLLSKCATSQLAQSISINDAKEQLTTLNDDVSSSSCLTLFRMHQSHYYHSRITTTPPQNKFVSFVKNVILVHQHLNNNNNNNNDGKKKKKRFEVGLNQFSDMSHTELNQMMGSMMREEDGTTTPWSSSSSEILLDLIKDDTGYKQSEEKKQEQKNDDSPTAGWMNKGTAIADQIRNSIENARKNNDPRAMVYNEREGDEKLDDHDDDDDDDDVVVSDGYGGMGIGGNSHGTNHSASVDDFDRFIDWSTDNNPDGVDIVHPPMDQGLCGSCWAISAIGTLEANVARHTAYDYYSNHTQTTNQPSPTLQQITQLMETRSIQTANLSVQELLDCDVWNNDVGCLGGNPISSFGFIHDYGLTSSDEYPYAGYYVDGGDDDNDSSWQLLGGTGGVCRTDKVMEPLVSVQSWGILTPNFEANMALAVRYLGPIAVGVNGAHPSFHLYRKGILDSEDCLPPQQLEWGGEAQPINHAILIVGYGEEEEEDDGEDGGKSITKYWIARNSWGKGWGENGYIRIKRNDSSNRGEPGICGIALTPSIALGGFFVQQPDFLFHNNLIDDDDVGLQNVTTASTEEMIAVDLEGRNTEIPQRNVVGGGYWRNLHPMASTSFFILLGGCVLSLFLLLLILPSRSRDNNSRNNIHQAHNDDLMAEQHQEECNHDPLPTREVEEEKEEMMGETSSLLSSSGGDPVVLYDGL